MSPEWFKVGEYHAANVRSILTSTRPNDPQFLPLCDYIDQLAAVVKEGRWHDLLSTITPPDHAVWEPEAHFTQRVAHPGDKSL